MPAFGDMREEAEYVNQYWEIDSTQLDAFGKDSNGDSTWTLISISDVKTAMKVITVAKTSNTNAIVELLYKAINKLGVPQHIKTDNGKDYLSNHFMGLLKRLGIKQLRTEPFAGEQKPFVERQFGTIQNSFTELLNGYKGHNVAQFKAIQSQTSTADRISGKTPDNNVEFIFDIATKLDEWIDYVYSREHNKSLGTSPYQAYVNDEQYIKRFDISQIAYAFGKETVVKVGKKGIRNNNKIYNNMEGMLSAYVGTECKLILDFIDMTTGYLFDNQGTFICVVSDDKISKDTAMSAKVVYKHEIKALVKENKKLAKQYKDTNLVKSIIDTSVEVFKDTQAIETVGGNGITQNDGNFEHLKNIGETIDKQIEKREILSSKPNLELHKQALENSIKRKEIEDAEKPKMTYAELIKRQA